MQLSSHMTPETSALDAIHDVASKAILFDDIDAKDEALDLIVSMARYRIANWTDEEKQKYQSSE
jgi:hypothetical protein